MHLSREDARKIKGNEGMAHQEGNRLANMSKSVEESGKMRTERAHWISNLGVTQWNYGTQGELEELEEEFKVA